MPQGKSWYGIQQGMSVATSVQLQAVHVWPDAPSFPREQPEPGHLSSSHPQAGADTWPADMEDMCQDTQEDAQRDTRARAPASYPLRWREGAVQDRLVAESALKRAGSAGSEFPRGSSGRRRQQRRGRRLERRGDRTREEPQDKDELNLEPVFLSTPISFPAGVAAAVVVSLALLVLPAVLPPLPTPPMGLMLLPVAVMGMLLLVARTL